MSTRYLVRLAVFMAGILPFAVCASAQQDYVSRYELYTGYMFLDSPNLTLFENGFHFQAGVNVTRWYAFGFDYSWANGPLLLTAGQLKTSLQQTLAPELTQLVMEGVIPPTYQLSVPTDSTTQTFAMGPQLTYRHFSGVTLFLRPSIGAINEVARPRGTDPVAQGIVMQLAPSGQKTDWTAFYGAGGGADLVITKHLGLRAQVDVVYNHLFNDLLQNGRTTVRFSVGPSFHFGRNVR